MKDFIRFCLAGFLSVVLNACKTSDVPAQQPAPVVEQAEEIEPAPEPEPPPPST